MQLKSTNPTIKGIFQSLSTIKSTIDSDNTTSDILTGTSLPVGSSTVTFANTNIHPNTVVILFLNNIPTVPREVYLSEGNALIVLDSATTVISEPKLLFFNRKE